MARSLSLLEFKRLLADIRDRRPDVRLRVRVLGKMWAERFYSIDFIAENQLVLHEESQDEYFYINNVSDVIQFEFESSFFGYQAFYHYEVLPSEQGLPSLASKSENAHAASNLKSNAISD